jgi:uncharacterized membrane protein
MQSSPLRYKLTGMTAEVLPGRTAETGGRGASLTWAGVVLGLAIGGFFDGILLHQVLQWHHFLSGVSDPSVQDIRVQILADGLFHVAMYLVGAVGLYLLWRARRELSRDDSGSALLGSVLIGFGAWQFLDVILAHWILVIHRIKMETDVPLAWDLGWLVLLGPPPLLAGWMLWRRGGKGPPIARGGVVAGLVALVLLAAAPVASLPPRDVTGAIVLFRPGLTPAAMMAAVTAAGGRMLWTDASGEVWGIDFEDPASARSLYGQGALLVSTSFFPAGCFTWSQPT